MTMRAGSVVMLTAKGIDFDARIDRSARSLAANGYAVTVLCRAADGRPATENANGYRVVSVPIAERAPALKASWRDVRARRRELEGEDGSAADRRRAAKLKRAETRLKERRQRAATGRDREKPFRKAWGDLLVELRPDVIHVHDETGLATALDAPRNGAVVIYDAHEHKSAESVPRRYYLRSHAPRADAVITVGPALADALVRDFGLAARPTLIHNTPALRSVRPAPYDVRTVTGLGADTPLLVYVGVITRQRRLDVVMRALVDLPAVHLALVVLNGMDELAATARDLRVAERVHIVPPVPHDTIVSLIGTADAGVIPLGRYPGGDVARPNKLFEYLHAGLPMVVSGSPEMAGFVQLHGLGEVASIDDVGAWRAAIERVLEERDTYRGDRRALCRTWSWETQEKNLLELYARLLARGNGVSARA